jgi:spoIIIJ-associated protein
MKTITKEAKTVDQCIQLFKNENNLSDDQYRYEIIEPGSKALLGFIGGKNAVVKFIIEGTDEKIKNYLRTFFELINIKFDSILIDAKNDTFTVTIINPEEPGFLIGKDGNFIDELEYLLNLAIFRNAENRGQIKLDIDGYRQRREDSLIREIRFSMSKVLKSKMSIKLKPMSSYERRVVHQMVLEDKRLKTMTVGDGRKRQVVISLSKPRTFHNNTNTDRPRFKKPVKVEYTDESSDKE